MKQKEMRAEEQRMNSTIFADPVVFFLLCHLYCKISAHKITFSQGVKGL